MDKRFSAGLAPIKASRKNEFEQKSSDACAQKKDSDHHMMIGVLKVAATYSPAVRSTIGDGGLNFSVRNGKRWDPAAITA